jgi:hypothetical protein
MKYIKNLSIISLIFGAACGILALVPIFGILILLMLIFCSAFIIMVFMKHVKLLPKPTEQTGMLWGGISGFVTFIGFSVIFVPCSFILSLIFKQSYYTGIGLIMKSGFMTMITLIFFIGILCAMMNAFSGLASIYFFNDFTTPQQDSETGTKFIINRKMRK